MPASRSRRSTRLAPLAFAAVGGLTLIGGCSTPTQYQSVKDDATPNLDTLYQRSSDIDNAMVVTFDENGRMFWQDLGRAFYTDRPSRLTREPVPRP